MGSARSNHKKLNSKELLFMFSIYYRTMYAVNQDFIKLCGLDAYRESMRDSDEDRNTLMRILVNIPRVIPYTITPNGGSVKLSSRDSLMSLKEQIHFENIEKDYQDIIDKNTTALSNIKTIRNKFEHSPHLMRQIIVESSGSSKGELFGFTYEIKDKTYELHYSDLLRLITQLNRLFDNIRDELITANEQEDTTANYKLLSMYELSLQRFNRIYSSNILKDVGRIMWPI